MISGRLTSVLLIPDLYVNGIETIELKSLSYEAWKVTSTASTETVAQGTMTSTTAASATSGTLQRKSLGRYQRGHQGSQLRIREG